MSDGARRVPASRVVWLVLALVALVLIAVFALSDVSTALTDDDETHARLMLQDAGHGAVLDRKPPAKFDDQVETILAVQDAVLSAAPDNKGLPLGKPRELRDLYEAKRGLCYDRSRAIEKVLTYLGFEVRHAAIYSTEKTGALNALLTPNTPSHAVTEVKTDRGWLVVDSNRRWIGLTRDGAPVDLAALRASPADQAWDKRLEQKMSPILGGSYTYVIGLYSRHGRFYAPYLPVPDIDWQQVPGNFID